jgi:hypothetical protein
VSNEQRVEDDQPINNPHNLQRVENDQSHWYEENLEEVRQYVNERNEEE